MSNIKSRELKDKTIKILDKEKLWTSRIKKTIIYSNEKTKSINEEEDNIASYGANRITDYLNFIKDEILNTSKRTRNYKKMPKSSIKENIKKSSIGIEELNKSALTQGKKLLIQSKKNPVKGVRNTTKRTISTIKLLIVGFKSLISLLLSFGTIAITIIVVICLVGLLCSSFFGIFFASEKIGKNNIKMSDCINELNEEINEKLHEIENTNPHDEIIIHSNKAEWRNVLALYSVKVSQENNVMIINNIKVEILRKIFWDINSINYEIKSEIYDNSIFIGTFGKNDSNLEERKVLHIYINSKTMEEMTNLYMFDSNQLQQLKELTSDKYVSLWNNVIYGISSNSEKYMNWKQNTPNWSNIKIGTTDRTIGDIGCLVTSISILIKKSGVPTSNIYPFNPGAFVQALNNNYGFDQYGNLQYTPISNLIPDFQYGGKVIIKGKTKEEKFNEIKKYYEAGYYLAVEVLGATDEAQHWVAIDKVTNDTIFMLDPGSNSTNMWNEYNWNNTTQIIYFKKINK